MSKIIYRVTEMNVDGCGGNAVEFVQFDQKLSEKEGLEFERALSAAKERAADSDTSEMVADACAIFGQYNAQICGAPYEGTFEF